MPEEIYNSLDVVFDMAIVQGVRNSPEQEEGEEPNPEIQYTGGSIDLLSSKALVNLQIFEDMFAQCVSGQLLCMDVIDWGARLPLTGEEVLWLDLKTPGGDTIELPAFYIYNVTSVESDDMPNGKGWRLDFSSWTHVVGNQDTSHLSGILSEDQDAEETEFMGPISELAEKVIKNNEAFKFGWDTVQDHEPFIEETSNKIYYQPNQGSYSIIRKDTEQRPLELLTQLAENSVSKENPNVVNFVFYQDLSRWNFKSIDSMVSEPSIKTFYGGMVSDGPISTGDPASGKNKILNAVNVIREHSSLENANNGFFASTMKFYKPRVDIQNYPTWFSDSIDSVYYRVNCNYKDHFPAALVGFEQIENYKARWRYAFAEVYLVFDYENNTPEFRIKPINYGGIRSWVVFKEDGPHWINGEEEQYDTFGRAAFNTMEQGNDGIIDYENRQGWESPGYRLDSKLWEGSCQKIQPIRGSFEGSQINNEGHLNNVKRHVTEAIPNDNESCINKYPIVDMKIYWDQENEPHYFFTSANAVDGECSEDDGDCLDADE